MEKKISYSKTFMTQGIMLDWWVPGCPLGKSCIPISERVSWWSPRAEPLLRGEAGGHICAACKAPVPIQCTSGLWAGARSCWEEKAVRGGPWLSESTHKVNQAFTTHRHEGGGRENTVRIPHSATSVGYKAGHWGERQSTNQKSVLRSGLSQPPSPHLELRTAREDI